MSHPASSLCTRAAAISYLPQRQAISLTLDNGAQLSVPVSLIPRLAQADVKDRTEVHASPNGQLAQWPALKLELNVADLVLTCVATADRMAALGRLAGGQRSEAKAEAARQNGSKGGRPRLVVSNPKRESVAGVVTPAVSAGRPAPRQERHNVAHERRRRHA